MQLRQVEPHSPELPNQSELFAEIVLEYERQCQVRVGRSPVMLLWKYSSHWLISWALCPGGEEGGSPDQSTEG